MTTTAVATSQTIKAVLCDIGGVLHVGSTPIPGVTEVWTQCLVFFLIAPCVDDSLHECVHKRLSRSCGLAAAELRFRSDSSPTRTRYREDYSSLGESQLIVACFSMSGLFVT